MSGHLTLVLGGTRSGKSEVAERLAERLAGGAGAVTYVATYRPDPARPDADMAARVAAHAARRPAGWATVEAGAELAPAVAAIDGPVLVDSLGTFLAGHPALVAGADPGHDRLPADLVALAVALGSRPAPTVVVSEEVGLGLHAPTAVGRRFTDLLGGLNRAVAERAGEVLLVVAGRVLPLGAVG